MRYEPDRHHPHAGIQTVFITINPSVSPFFERESRLTNLILTLNLTFSTFASRSTCDCVLRPSRAKRLTRMDLAKQHIHPKLLYSS